MRSAELFAYFGSDSNISGKTANCFLNRHRWLHLYLCLLLLLLCFFSHQCEHILYFLDSTMKQLHAFIRVAESFFLYSSFGNSWKLQSKKILGCSSRPKRMLQKMKYVYVSTVCIYLFTINAMNIL